MKRIFLLSMTIAMVCSCSIYRKYERPENILPMDSLYVPAGSAEDIDTPGRRCLPTRIFRISSGQAWKTTRTFRAQYCA